MAFICLILKWLGCPVFKWHLKTRPFGIQRLFNHLNTRLVWYWDPHCILHIWSPCARCAYIYYKPDVLKIGHLMFSFLSMTLKIHRSCFASRKVELTNSNTCQLFNFLPHICPLWASITCAWSILRGSCWTPSQLN